MCRFLWEGGCGLVEDFWDILEGSDLTDKLFAWSYGFRVLLEGRKEEKKEGREGVVNSGAENVSHNLPSSLNSMSLLPLPLSPFLLNTYAHKMHLFWGPFLYLSNLKERKICISKAPMCLDKISSVEHLESSAWGFLPKVAAFLLPDFPNNSFWNCLNWQHTNCFSQWLFDSLILIPGPTSVSLFLCMFIIL